MKWPTTSLLALLCVLSTAHAATPLETPEPVERRSLVKVGAEIVEASLSVTPTRASLRAARRPDVPLPLNDEQARTYIAGFKSYTIDLAHFDQCEPILAKFVEWEATAREIKAEPFEKEIGVTHPDLSPEPQKFLFRWSGSAAELMPSRFDADQVRALLALYRAERKSIDAELIERAKLAEERKAKAAREAALFK